MERVNSTRIYLIYYKNFCRCHNVPPPSPIEKTKRNLSSLPAKARCFVFKNFHRQLG
jgi:hypothetical protein